MTTEATLGSIGADLVERDICSLSPDELTERVALVRAEILPHVIATTELADGVAWEFESGDDMRTRLESLATLERECCGGGLEFAVWEAREAGRLRFEVRGEGAAAFRADSSGLVANSPTRRTGGWRPLARAGGIGAAVSFFLCCVLPIGLVAFLGLSVAAPLLALDDPLTIATGAVAIGLGWWLYERRRDKAAAAASGCDC